mgnify:CR=1 FL=1
MDYKQTILDELTTIMNHEKQSKNTFKARAYGKAIKGLSLLDKIESLNDVLKANVEGIGKSIAEKIKEIIETGHSHKAETIREDPVSKAKEAFMNIYGVGAKKADALVKAGYMGIEDLRNNKNGLALLNEKQKIGLKYYEDILERIPRAEMDMHNHYLQSTVDTSASLQIVGSYRRGLESSGDIDVLITGNVEMDTFIDGLMDDGYITETLALGPKKFMGMCKIGNGYKHRRIDILWCPPEEYIFSLVYFTGSDKFNIQMRKKALEKGWTLNEHSMKSVASGLGSMTFKTEKNLFDFLEMPYLEPHER